MLHKQSLLVDTAMTPSDTSDQRMWGYNVRTKQLLMLPLLEAVPVPAAAAKQGYAVNHISDSEDLEVFEEEIRDGGASSSD